MITITLKDGTTKQYNEGISILEIAKDISEGLARVAMAASVDGKLTDLRAKIDADCQLSILTFDDDSGKWAFRHTAAHVLAQAIKRVFPEAKLAIGPATDAGFYYDIDLDRGITPEDLPVIEAEMKKIVKEELVPERYELPRAEALKWAKDEGDIYKFELISDLPEDAVISFYKQGEFVDLCAGPHIMNTKMLKAMKLTSIAGAYWRGNEKNKMLTRVYGTAFTKAAELEEYLHKIEEAKKRDHRKLGRELGLFTMFEEGPGFPFFLPKGMVVKNILIDYWRQLHKRSGYQEISTPVMMSKSLWEKSGHWAYYSENMYTTEIEEQAFVIKPMNCPGGIMVYGMETHSYRELPIRYGELGVVHRYEKSGALHGLMRVRCFTQDDAHLFMTQEHIKDEIKGVIALVDEIYTLFGFKYHVELSTRPENSMGKDEDWEFATEALREALEEKEMVFKVNEGDGAFYGPKIDFHIEDSIGRTWQCATIQLDFQLPEKFDLEYIGSDGQKHRPAMIHRTVLGSIERFIGILIEHFAGQFPVWIAPVQAIVLPISDKYIDYAKEVEAMLNSAGIRVETDHRAEKIGYKIREARMQRIPYLLVVGEKEVEAKTASVRSHHKGDEGAMPLSEIKDRILEEIRTKVIHTEEAQ